MDTNIYSHELVEGLMEGFIFEVQNKGSGLKKKIVEDELAARGAIKWGNISPVAFFVALAGFTVVLPGNSRRHPVT